MGRGPTLATTSDALRLRILRTGSVRVRAGRIAWTSATPMIEALQVRLGVSSLKTVGGKG